MIDTIPADPTFSDATAPRAGDAAERRCLVTARVLPRAQLVRFVASPDGVITPDLEARLPGRGLWVSAERKALDRAVTKRLFGKAAGATVAVPADLAERTAGLLERRCLQVVGMARRAGLALAGFEAVRIGLAGHQVAVMLVASDAGPHGRAKLERLSALGEVPVADDFDSASLGQALGRDMVVHAALAPSGLATLLLTELGRLRGLRSGTPPAKAAGPFSQERSIRDSAGTT